MTPDPKQIAVWKQEYGHVYAFDYDETFYFRAITVGEFDFLDSQDPGLKTSASEDALVRYALLYPLDFDLDQAPAGLISVLAEEIWNASAFGNPRYAQQLMEEYREKIHTSLPDYMKVLILTALPYSYTESDLMNMSFDQLAQKTALAEEVLRIRAELYTGAEVKLEIVDPEEEALAKKQAQDKQLRQKQPGAAVANDPIAAKLRRAGA